MHLLKENFFNSDFVNILSLVANLVEIGTVLVLAFLVIKKKNSSLIWSQISQFLGYLFRSVIALVVLTLFARLTYSFLFPFFVLIFKESWQGQSWEKGYEILYTLSYLCYGAIVLPIAYVILATLITFSNVPAKRFLNAFLPPNSKLKIETPQDFVIKQATYGTPEHYYDVTDILNKMSTENGLVIKANNSLKGDPAPNQVKQLTIDYIYKGKSFNAILAEGATDTIPKKVPSE